MGLGHRIRSVIYRATLLKKHHVLLMHYKNPQEGGADTSALKKELQSAKRGGNALKKRKSVEG